MLKELLPQYTVSHKKCHYFVLLTDIHESILISFGRYVSEKAIKR